MKKLCPIRLPRFAQFYLDRIRTLGKRSASICFKNYFYLYLQEKYWYIFTIHQKELWWILWWISGNSSENPHGFSDHEGSLWSMIREFMIKECIPMDSRTRESSWILWFHQEPTLLKLDYISGIYSEEINLMNF